MIKVSSQTFSTASWKSEMNMKEKEREREIERERSKEYGHSIDVLDNVYGCLSGCLSTDASPDAFLGTWIFEFFGYFQTVLRAFF